MQRRERILAIILLGAVVLWQGGPLISRTILDPMDFRQADLESVEQAVKFKQQAAVRLARSEQQLRTWQQRSLPPDPLVAQRLYQQWLRDLAKEAGFAELKVDPERRTPKDEGHSLIEVSVAGEATLDQICLFLFRFYRTDLLHRVTTMDLHATDNKNNPLIKVSLTAQGLAIAGAPARTHLFPQSTLAVSLNASDNSLVMTSPLELYKDATFVARAGTEYMTVVDVTEHRLQVDRAAEGSLAVDHQGGDLVEFIPINVQAQQTTLAAYRAMIEQNPFVIPTPKNVTPVVKADDKVEEPMLDAAEFTYLIGTISNGSTGKALLFDRLNNQRLVVPTGQAFTMASLQAKIVSVHLDHIVLRDGEMDWRLNVGDNLRSMEEVKRRGGEEERR